MSKTLRLTEKWMQRGLWLVALVFASFLIGLGGTLVGDLPKVEKQLVVDDFMDAPAAAALRANIQTAERAGQQADSALEQAQLKQQVAQSDTAAARETFNNWLATRRATQLADQDPELLARTKALDALKTREQTASAAVQAQQQAALDARPFVWGFIYFALFAFFVELVPYLPSYGGYVRYVVGIVLTVLVGRQAIVALNRYLERQKLAEQMPDAQRREELSYDTALARLAKGVCPGCERPVDLKNPDIDFCPHCGIGLFDHCHACQARKSAFAKFCHACGAAGARLLKQPAAPQT